MASSFQNYSQFSLSIKSQDKTSPKSNHFLGVTTAHIPIQLYQFLVSSFWRVMRSLEQIVAPLP